MRDPQPSRRSFLSQSSAAVAASTLLSGRAFARGDDVIKVGLVGCGGRGTGAAEQAMTADKGVRLVAMADAFDEPIENSANALKNSPVGEQVDLKPENRYVGFDAYKALIDQVDVVLLTSPPAFRPTHLAYAIDKGKHVFCEKPIATDAPGVRSVLETCKKAREKGVSLISGHCWRYEPGRRETMAQVFSGAIGDIVAIETTYNSQGIWEPRRTREQCKSDLEYQLRNWYYYTWLSGDHIVEQAVHGVDTMGWATGDKPPIQCWGTGGRQVRTDPKFGNIYDHFSIVYEYPNNVRGYHTCRHWAGAANRVKDYILGAKGMCDVFGNSLSDGDKTTWRYRGPKANMYQVEHDELFAAIRSGKPLYNLESAVNSTLLAIMGRMAAYTGQVVTYEQALNSQEKLVPDAFGWDMPAPEVKVAIPGVTKFV